MQILEGEKMIILECNKLISENIQRIISEIGIKHNVVAARVNLTQNAFSAMLHGRKRIKPCDVNIIASALGGIGK